MDPIISKIAHYLFSAPYSLMRHDYGALMIKVDGFEQVNPATINVSIEVDKTENGYLLASRYYEKDGKEVIYKMSSFTEYLREAALARAGKGKRNLPGRIAVKAAFKLYKKELSDIAKDIADGVGEGAAIYFTPEPSTKDVNLWIKKAGEIGGTKTDKEDFLNKNMHSDGIKKLSEIFSGL